jgi:hypothetical protein
VFTQLSGAVPGFTGNTATTSSLIGSQESGQVSPQTMNALKTGAAEFGTANGMPGSGLEQNQLFGNIAGFSEGLQQKGIQNYLAMVSGLGPTMTHPELAAQISARNTDLAAAPDPKLAAQEQFNLWLKGMQYAQGAGGYGNGPGRWGGGGTLGPTHSNWGGMGINPPTDSLGFPSYNMSSPDTGGVMTATASPPPGGWPGAQPWNAGFAVGAPGNRGYNYGPTSGAFYPGLTYDEEQGALAGGGAGANQGFESSEYAGGGG